MAKRKCLYEGHYIGLYSDGTIGVSDGVGYSGEMDETEVKELYEALKKLFKVKEVCHCDICEMKRMKE